VTDSRAGNRLSQNLLLELHFASWKPFGLGRILIEPHRKTGAKDKVLRMGEKADSLCARKCAFSWQNASIFGQRDAFLPFPHICNSLFQSSKVQVPPPLSSKTYPIL
jgi:hypothetical protein